MIAFPNVKINLGLDVLRKREDGYHDLDTLFLPYHDIHDVLEIVSGDDYSRTSAGLFSRYREADGSLVQKISPDGKVMVTIARKDGVGWDPLDDLTVKAYRLLDSAYGLPPVKIFLEKLSPVGAGLGGGSADAAYTVTMLDSMFSLSMDRQQMAGYASRLGSDCAFFIYNTPMLGRGRGEILTEYPGISVSGESDRIRCQGTEYEVKVVVPEGVPVSTAEAYKGIVPHVPDIPLEEVLGMSPERWRDLLSNDFEKTVFALYPQLASIKQSLYDSGAVYASMSGSGSALFGIYRTDGIQL